MTGATSVHLSPVLPDWHPIIALGAEELLSNQTLVKLVGRGVVSLGRCFCFS